MTLNPKGWKGITAACVSLVVLLAVYLRQAEQLRAAESRSWELERVMAENRGLAAEIAAKSREIAAVSPSARTTDTASFKKLLDLISRSQQHNDVLGKNAAYANLTRDRLRGPIQKRYEDFFPQLNLSPGDLRALKELLTDRLESRAATYKVAQEQGLKVSQDEADQIRTLSGEGTDAKIAALLGAPGYQALLTYDRQDQVSSFDVGNWTLDVENAGLAVSSAQKLALGADWTALRSGLAEMDDPPPGFAATLLARAAGYLDAAQLAVLSHYLETRARSKATEKIISAQLLK